MNVIYTNNCRIVKLPKHISAERDSSGGLAVNGFGVQIATITKPCNGKIKAIMMNGDIVYSGTSLQFAVNKLLERHKMQ